MISTIAIKGIRCFGYHGVFEHEKTNGQEFIVDVEITADISEAIATDDVSKTVDYGYISEMVSNIVSNTRFNLIESLANEIAHKVKLVTAVQGVTVIVHKPLAPIAVPFNDVFVKVQLP